MNFMPSGREVTTHLFVTLLRSLNDEPFYLGKRFRIVGRAQAGKLAIGTTTYWSTIIPALLGENCAGWVISKFQVKELCGLEISKMGTCANTLNNRFETGSPSRRFASTRLAAYTIC
jgi:hypothetical protein